MSIEVIQDHIRSQYEAYLQAWVKFVAQPSISAQNIGVRECAKLLQSLMEEAGIKSACYETSGHPIIFGEIPSPNPQAPTVIFYGHYDVQPPEPLELWHSPPFEPTIRDGRLYGRGTADNKGQLIAHILAVKSFLAVKGSLPIHAKFVFEGEEESGSPYLAEFVQAHGNLLEADLVYVSDGPMYEDNVPVIKFGNRGVFSIEISLETATQDNHSGNKGGVIPNAAWELVQLLSTMTDRDGRVTVKGFYDDVLPPTEFDMQLLEDLPYDNVAISKVFGVETISLDKITFYRKLLLEPTMTINGLISGYTGPGGKTIIPCKASAKLDMRLVDNQYPDDIFRKIGQHVAKHNPYAKVHYGYYMLPSRTAASHPLCRAVIDAVSIAYRQKPLVFPAGGGSLPNYVWTKILNIPTVGVPYANVDEDNHAPNENMRLDCFYQGIHTSAQVMYHLGQYSK